MQRKSKPLTWRGRGLSDTEDASSTFSGAMASLSNLIPDPATARLWMCRPAAQQFSDVLNGPFSSGFSSGFQHSAFFGGSGFISAALQIGDTFYGMIAGPGGRDLPFAFNCATSTLITPTGTTPSNTPTSPQTTGTWTPPTMALIGSKLIVTHPGFNGSGNVFFGYLDISNPAAPVWHGANLTGTVQFTTVPSAVAQFNNRAYFITNSVAQPAVVFTDVLNPLNVTNANQILTFGDTAALTAIAGLPLNNQLGGIVQALIVFKGVANMYQITGDAALNTLEVNALNMATGTLGPKTITPTPKGLAFIAPDGLRIIDFNGNVSDPIGFDGNGVTLPFSSSVVPSRMVAACNGSLYRVTTQNGNIPSTPTFEYWYDFARQVWSGPHTFPANQIVPWRGTFIMCPIASMGTLWQSDPIQNLTSTFTENGVPLTWTWQTPLLPDTDEITNNAMTEGTLDMAFGPSGTATVAALDQNAATIDSVTLTSTGAPTIWGAFNWGAAVWGGGTNALAPLELQWPEPIVFARMSIKATGNSAQAIRIGALHMRYQQLRTLTNIGAAA